MSQFEGVSPATLAITRRPKNVSVDPVQINQSLDAPGLAVPPPVSRGAQIASDLERSLGLVGQVASQISRTNAANAWEAERAQARLDAENEKINRAVEQHDRALARLDGREFIIQADKDVREGKLKPEPGSGMSMLEFAKDIVAKKTEGQPSAYSNEFRDTVEPVLFAALTEHVKELGATATKANNEILQRGALVTERSTQLMQMVAAYRLHNPDKTDLEAKSFLLIPALTNAAEAGDPKRFEAVSSLLGPEFEPERRIAAATLAKNQQDDLEESRRSFRNDVARRLNDVFAGKGGSFNQVESWLESQRGSRIDEATILSEMDRVRTEKRRVEREASDLQSVTEKQTIADDHLRRATSLADAGLLWSAEGLDTVTPGGVEIKMSRADTIRVVTSRAMSAIAETSPDQNTAVDRQMRWASQNAIVPDGWSRTLEAGFSSLSVGDAAATGTASVPKQTVAGFDLYKRMKAKAPGLIVTAGLDGEAQKFYELAATLQQDSAFAGDDARTLVQARMLMSGPGRGQIPELKDREIRSAAMSTASRWWKGEATNVGEVAAHIEGLARVKVLAGISPSAAVSQAANEVNKSRVFIGNWSVSLADARLPESLRGDSMQRVAAKVIHRYLDTKGKGSGMGVDDLTLRQDAGSGLWYLAEGRTGTIVPFSKAADVMFDAKDLTRTLDEINRGDADEAVVKTLNKWNRRHAGYWDVIPFSGPGGIGVNPANVPVIP